MNAVKKTVSIMLIAAVFIATCSFTVSAAGAPAIKPIPNLAGLTTQEKVVAVAKSQVGYKEAGKDITAYGEWFHEATKKTGNCAWCAIYASWVLNKAGAGSLITASYTAGAKSLGLLNSKYGHSYSWQDIKNGNYTPKPGDIISYAGTSTANTASSKLSYANGHVGIVIEEACRTQNKKGKNVLVVETVDGNWSNQVYQRKVEITLSNGATGMSGGNAYVYCVSNPGYNLYDDVVAWNKNVKNTCSNLVLQPTKASIKFYDNPSEYSKNVVTKNVSGLFLHAEQGAKNAGKNTFYRIDNADDASLIGKYVSSAQVKQVNKTPTLTLSTKLNKVTAVVSNAPATAYRFTFKDGKNVVKSSQVKENKSEYTSALFLHTYKVSVVALWKIGNITYSSPTATKEILAKWIL